MPEPPPGGTEGNWHFPSLTDLIPGWSELQAVKALIAELSDYRMWRSLGWLLAGAALVYVGLLFWLRLPQAGVRVIGDAAKAAI